jgi:hypothetical protein
MRGCTLADHTTRDSIAEAPLAVLPVFQVTNQLAAQPNPRALLYTITPTFLEKLAAAKAAGQPVARMLTATFPGAVGVHSLDVVAAALALLHDFVRSDYYGHGFYAECTVYTRAFEAQLKREAVARSWDVERAVRDVEPGAADDDDAATPYRETLSQPHARLAVVQRLRQRDDLAGIARLLIPFYVVARVDHAPQSATQRHYATHNRRFEVLLAPTPLS